LETSARQKIKLFAVLFVENCPRKDAKICPVCGQRCLAVFLPPATSTWACRRCWKLRHRSSYICPAKAARLSVAVALSPSHLEAARWELSNLLPLPDENDIPPEFKRDNWSISKYRRACRWHHRRFCQLSRAIADVERFQSADAAPPKLKRGPKPKVQR
jgi:RNA polymerase subunit RPABC4/transcription elongation factor Spt4